MLSVEYTSAPAAMLTFAGLRVTVRPRGDDAAVSETVPLNPFKLVSVIADVAEPPARTVSGLGTFAVSVKVGLGGGRDVAAGFQPVSSRYHEL